jgi:hypothetical protein
MWFEMDFAFAPANPEAKAGEFYFIQTEGLFLA